MTKYCGSCEKHYDCTVKKCPVCNQKLKACYTKEEWAQIQKQNDDFIAINMIM